MDEKKTRLAAADLLLERGIRYTVSDAPFLFRLFRLNRIEISALKPGTIVEICRVMIQENLESAPLEQLRLKLGAICQIVAISVLNDKRKIERQTRRLAQRFMWRFPASVLIRVFLDIQELNSAMDFTVITGFYQHQTAMMMNPGQKKNGS